MNINGVKIEVDQIKRKVFVNGESIPFARFMTGESVNLTNSGIVIDGYHIENGEWVK